MLNKKLSRLFLLYLFILPCLFSSSAHAYTTPSTDNPASWQLEENLENTIKDIHQEIYGFGFQNNRNYIKREFHMNLDGNERNKEEHVVVINHDQEDRERMLIQITIFESTSSIYKSAIECKEIMCVFYGDKLKIDRSGYSYKEIKGLLPSILKGIRDKKKILELIDKK